MSMIPRLPASTPPASVTKWRRLVRTRNRIIGLWLGGIAVELLVFPMASIAPIKDLVLGVACLLTFVWIGACIAGIVFQSRLEQHIKETVYTEDITCMGYWIDTLYSSVSTVCYPQMVRNYYAMVRERLLEQLPHLTEETSYLLGANERRALYKTLRGKDAAMILAVLKALPLFGDSKALPYVQNLADGKGVAATNSTVLEEAQSSLSRLQAVLALSSGAQGLLRASQPPPAPTEELLIPARANDNTSEKELLRADVSGNRSIESTENRQNGDL